jgi:curli production assembly/transport component CsgE
MVGIGIALSAAILTCLDAMAESRLADDASGKPQTAKKARRELDGGVITNQTVTVAGQDFYQYFVAAWREREMSERFAISVRERPSARWGSQVWIEYAQRRIFQAQLPSGRSGIKAVSEQAVDVAYQQLADAEAERVLFKDPDVGPDEM